MTHDLLVDCLEKLEWSSESCFTVIIFINPDLEGGFFFFFFFDSTGI
jgi:hypothetical protein